MRNAFQILRLFVLLITLCCQYSVAMQGEDDQDQIWKSYNPMIVQFSNPTGEPQKLFIEKNGCKQLYELTLSPKDENGSAQMFYGGDASWWTALRIYQAGRSMSMIYREPSTSLFVQRYEVLGGGANLERLTNSWSVFIDHPFFKETYDKFRFLSRNDAENVFNHLCENNNVKFLILKQFVSFLDLKTLEDLPLNKQIETP